jgi:hypothetical protein
VTGAGEEPTADEIKDGLEVLNEIIEQTSIVKLLSFFQTEIIFPMIGGKLTYTVGPSSTTPDIVAARPVEILTAFCRRPTGNNQPVDLPIFVAAKQDYDRLQSKFTTVAGWEQAVYYEAGYPKGTLFFYQVPADSLSEIHLTVSAQLAPFLTLNDEVVLPPGYPQWLRYTLGQHLAPEYGFVYNEQMQELQANAEDILKQNNSKPMPIAASGLSNLASKAGGTGSYNVYSDTTRGTS